MKINIKQELTKQWFKNLQEIICKNIEELENNKVFFKGKTWSRNKKKNEGGGESKLLENGKIFDRVGVNFSEVFGKFPSPSVITLLVLVVYGEYPASTFLQSLTSLRIHKYKYK